MPRPAPDIENALAFDGIAAFHGLQKAQLHAFAKNAVHGAVHDAAAVAVDRVKVVRVLMKETLGTVFGHGLPRL
jgi:hypothetical protein